MAQGSERLRTGLVLGGLAAAGGLLAVLIDPIGVEPVLFIGGLFTGGLAAGVLLDVLIDFVRRRRLPHMLPHYRREHLRLRQLAQQLRQNLCRLTGIKSNYPELDEILRRDANLRHRATLLRMEILKEARRGLTWIDHLRAGLGLLGEGYPMTTGRIDRTEWVWRAYRAKLEREVQHLGRKLERNRNPHLEEQLVFAYRQKARELASFYQLETTLQQLETEMGIIVTGLESMLMKTLQLGTAVGTPAAASVSTDELLEPLRQQLRAFEQAMQEMQAMGRETSPPFLHLSQGTRER